MSATPPPLLHFEALVDWLRKDFFENNCCLVRFLPRRRYNFDRHIYVVCLTASCFPHRQPSKPQPAVREGAVTVHHY